MWSVFLWSEKAKCQLQLSEYPSYLSYKLTLTTFNKLQTFKCSANVLNFEVMQPIEM